MIQRQTSQPTQRSQHSAFTIIELIVSMAVLTATMIAVAMIFRISSEAAGRTEAHAEVLEASAAFQQTVSSELSRIVGGLLIIESPPPTDVRAEISDGPEMFRLRHDRLVFIASQGSEGPYQSFTDPTRGFPGDLNNDPAKAPASAPEALIYYGPGIPVAGDGTPTGVRRLFDDNSVNLTATEWVFAHRAILLMVNDPNPPVPGWVPLNMIAFDNGLMTSTPEYYEARMDALVAGPNAPGTIASRIEAALGAASLAAPPAMLADLWSPNLTPITTSLTDSTDADYYGRSGFTFQPRMVDFRIEWTDGRRIDPNGPDNDPATLADNDERTRWFGLAPDPTTGTDYQARTRFAAAGNPSNPDVNNPDNPPSESAYFSDPIAGNGIEWAPFGTAANALARYRAVWRTDSWQYRPKALRFTYRIYDATRRLKQPTTVDFNEDGIADPDPIVPARPYIVTRFGQEFSIVVPIP